MREGEAAAVAGARAMIDVSDGLLADAGHLCEQSGIGVQIDAPDVPRAAGVEEVEKWSGSAGIALSGGDDYELCFAIGPDDLDAVTRAVTPTAVTVVGRFVEGTSVEVAGATAPEIRGWDSFR